MTYEIIHYPDDESSLYSSALAAHIASVSLDFLVACEREGLIIRRSTPGGHSGFTLPDIRRMVVIRRLHEDLELSLPAIDVILQLREQVEELSTRRRRLEQELEIQRKRFKYLRKIIRQLQAY